MSNSIIAIISICIMLFCGGVCYAEPAAMDLNKIMSCACTKNALVNDSRYNLSESQSLIRQARSRDNPELRIKNIAVSDMIRNANAGYFTTAVRVHLQNPWEKKLRVQRANLNYEMDKLQMNLVMQEILFNSAYLFRRLSVLALEREAYEQLRRRLKVFEGSMRRGIESGMASSVDQTRFEMSLMEVDDVISDLELEIEDTSKLLGENIGIEPDNIYVNKDDSIDFNLVSDTKESSVEQNINVPSEFSKSYTALLDHGWRVYLPWPLFLEAEYDVSGNLKPDNWQFQAVFSIPLFVGRKMGWVEELKAENMRWNNNMAATTQNSQLATEVLNGKISRLKGELLNGSKMNRGKYMQVIGNLARQSEGGAVSPYEAANLMTKAVKLYCKHLQKKLELEGAYLELKKELGQFVCDYNS